MRIVHVIITLHPKSGGPPLIAASLAAAQARLGHEVELVTYRHEDKAGEFEAYLKKTYAPLPGFELVKVVDMPMWDRMETLLARRAGRVLEERIQGADFVHLHGVWDAVLAKAGRVSKAAGVPYCILLNGMLDFWCMAQKPLKKKAALAVAFRRMLTEAAFLHTGNVDEEAALVPLDLPTPRRRIPNGVFPEAYREVPYAWPDRSAFDAKFPAHAGKRFVLFLSRLHHKKGLDYLADAFAIVAPKFPEVQLVVAGPDGGERAPFEALIAKHGLTERTHVIGPQYGTDKLAVLSACDVFCLPSRQEGFSMAITEAVGFGVPVVVSKECHFPEVQEAGAGRCTPLDAQSVAAALGEVLGSAALRREMSAKGRELIEGGYTWPRIAERTIAAYREFVGKKGGG